jgi:hypothetical protein
LVEVRLLSAAWLVREARAKLQSSEGSTIRVRRLESFGLF